MIYRLSMGRESMAFVLNFFVYSSKDYIFSLLPLGETPLMLMLYAYRVLTGLLILWLIATAIVDILQLPMATGILRQLGYPTYMAVIIGSCKVVAIAALLYPRTRVLREWAYAGLFFILVGSYISHCLAHLPVSQSMRPLIVLTVLVGSYLMRPEELKLRTEN
jgi:DoxX-like family